MVAPQEVVFVKDKGTHTLVDVRPAELFATGHIAEAVNVPYYRPIEGWCVERAVYRCPSASLGGER